MCASVSFLLTVSGQLELKGEEVGRSMRVKAEVKELEGVCGRGRGREPLCGRQGDCRTEWPGYSQCEVLL